MLAHEGRHCDTKLGSENYQLWVVVLVLSAQSLQSLFERGLTAAAQELRGLVLDELAGGL